jgi:hypothetical protein
MVAGFVRRRSERAVESRLHEDAATIVPEAAGYTLPLCAGVLRCPIGHENGTPASEHLGAPWRASAHRQERYVERSTHLAD